MPFGVPDTPLEGVVPNDYDPAMTRGGTVLVALTVLVGGALTACSSDDASTAPASAVATTVAPTTDPPATSTIPTTTTAPTTTVDRAAQLAADVEADLLEAFRLTDLAIQDPTNEEKVTAALDLYVESNRDVIEAQIEELRNNGWVARPNPDFPAAVIVESPGVLNGPAADSAVIRVCQVDTWIIVEPGAGPGGSDAVVNPDVASYRTNYVMALIDGSWRIRGGEPLGRWPEVGCPAE